MQKNSKTEQVRPHHASTLIDSKGNSVYYQRNNKRVYYKGVNGRPANQTQEGMRDGMRANGGEILRYRYNYIKQNGKKK